MKPRFWIMIGILLVVAGCILFCGVMTSLNWDFTKLATTNYETNEYTISESYQSISIVTNTADIALIPTDNAQTRVVCHEEENMKHAVTVKEGVLTVQVEDTRQWYGHIGIGFSIPKVTVYLPYQEYNALSVESDTGSIQVENFDAQKIDLSVTTGKIVLNNTVCNEDVTIQVTTGKAEIDQLQCKVLRTEGDTGDAILKNVIATEAFFIERSTGDVKFESCDAGEISVETDTGNVTGNLLTDKVFITETDTGKIDVPKTASGGRCEITTDTGDIKITVS